MSNTCQRCNRIFKYPSHLERHLFSKKSCITSETDDFTCPYCNQKYKHKTSLNYHMNTSCKSVPPSIKSKILQKRINRKKASSDSSIIPVENLAQTQEDQSSLVVDNTQNTQNTENKSLVINGDVTILINNKDVPRDKVLNFAFDAESVAEIRKFVPTIQYPLFQEDMSCFQDKAYVKRIFNRYSLDTFTSIVYKLYSTDGNQNVAIPNIKRPDIQFVDDDLSISISEINIKVRAMQRELKLLYSQIYTFHKDIIDPCYYKDHEELIKNMMIEIMPLPESIAMKKSSSSEEESDEDSDEEDAKDDRRPRPGETLAQFSIRVARERDAEAAAKEAKAYEFTENYNQRTREIIMKFLAENSQDFCVSMKHHKKTITEIKKIRKEPKKTNLPYCGRDKLFKIMEAEKIQKELNYKKIEDIKPDTDQMEDDINKLEKYRGIGD